MLKPPHIKVSCIIPVYNEEARIEAVLRAVSDHPLIDEVLVIDDGSSDDSAKIAAAMPGITLIQQLKNGGKTKALTRGFSAMRGSLILMLDGDLLGLTANDITRLIAPVQKGEADISISLRGNSPLLWRAIGIDYISGERVLHRNLLPANFEELERLPRFGFEVYLNDICIKAKTKIKVVNWQHVKSPAKEKKFGFWSGLGANLRMIRDIFQTIPASHIVGQIIAMRKLRIR